MSVVRKNIPQHPQPIPTVAVLRAKHFMPGLHHTPRRDIPREWWPAVRPAPTDGRFTLRVMRKQMDAAHNAAVRRERAADYTLGSYRDGELVEVKVKHV